MITQQNVALLANKAINYMDPDSRLVIKKRTGSRLKIHHVEVRSPPSLVYLGETNLFNINFAFLIWYLEIIPLAKLSYSVFSGRLRIVPHFPLDIPSKSCEAGEFTVWVTIGCLWQTGQ